MIVKERPICCFWIGPTVELVHPRNVPWASVRVSHCTTTCRLFRKQAERQAINGFADISFHFGSSRKTWADTRPCPWVCSSQWSRGNRGGRMPIEQRLDLFQYWQNRSCFALVIFDGVDTHMRHTLPDSRTIGLKKLHSVSRRSFQAEFPAVPEFFRIACCWWWITSLASRLDWIWWRVYFAIPQTAAPANPTSTVIAARRKPE